MSRVPADVQHALLTEKLNGASRATLRERRRSQKQSRKTRGSGRLETVKLVVDGVSFVIRGRELVLAKLGQIFGRLQTEANAADAEGWDTVTWSNVMRSKAARQ
jgi:hypothetical protein